MSDHTTSTQDMDAQGYLDSIGIQGAPEHMVEILLRYDVADDFFASIEGSTPRIQSMESPTILKIPLNK